MKESAHQEDITILNTYITNNRASNNMQQKRIELKGEIDKFTIKFRDFPHL